MPKQITRDLLCAVKKIKRVYGVSAGLSVKALELPNALIQISSGKTWLK